MKFEWKTKYTWILIVVIIAIFSLVADFLIPISDSEEEFWWSHIHGFFAALGLFGCIAIVMIAKWLGRYWLQRKEDYYD
ncbi:MAG: hypothetical protein FJ022_05125 [Chloroflexi bacterium]|nr:hypothetical protein [Chloroflexota bacterium]MBM3174822.1 hypothetical protein [Chloroflexota bacterium]MBM4450173.1 hypothetical protein [Chloroflexota bacterium]